MQNKEEFFFLLCVVYGDYFRSGQPQESSPSEPTECPLVAYIVKERF